MRSVLEGVAFSLRDALDIITLLAPLTEALTTGGGARSDVWLQLTTDVMALPLVRPKQSQGPAYGAALLALQGVGYTDKAAELARLESDKTFVPDEPEAYQDALGRYHAA